MRTAPEEKERRQAAYDAGLSDRAAARHLGIQQDTFRSWRRARGLMPNPANESDHYAPTTFEAAKQQWWHRWACAACKRTGVVRASHRRTAARNRHRRRCEGELVFWKVPRVQGRGPEQATPDVPVRVEA